MNPKRIEEIVDDFKDRVRSILERTNDNTDYVEIINSYFRIEVDDLNELKKLHDKHKDLPYLPDIEKVKILLISLSLLGNDFLGVYYNPIDDVLIRDYKNKGHIFDFPESIENNPNLKLHYVLFNSIFSLS
jgi:hypothetical protein